MKEKVLIALLQGNDLESQGAQAVANARVFLSDLIDELGQKGPLLLTVGLPIARRLLADAAWPHKFHIQDFIQFCETKTTDYPTGEHEHGPDLDAVAQYLADCAKEYHEQKW